MVTIIHAQDKITWRSLNFLRGAIQYKIANNNNSELDFTDAINKEKALYREILGELPVTSLAAETEQVAA